MSSCYELVDQGGIVSTKANERFGCLRCNDKAASYRAIRWDVKVLEQPVELFLGILPKLRVDRPSLRLHARGDIRKPIKLDRVDAFDTFPIRWNKDGMILSKQLKDGDSPSKLRGYMRFEERVILLQRLTGSHFHKV